MTAYFTLVVECNKNFNDNNLILDFYSLLTENGLTFTGKCSNNAANYSLSEIAAKNYSYLLNEKNSKNVENYNGHDSINAAVVVQMFFVQWRIGSVLWLAVSKIRDRLRNDSAWSCSFDFRFADDHFFINRAFNGVI